MSMAPSNPAQASVPARSGRLGPKRLAPGGKVTLSKVEQKAETRGRLREAALSLFATRGYDATSASDIAALAGVSDRTFFLHFPTKADAIMGIGEDRLLDLLVEKIVSCESCGSDLVVVQVSLTRWMDAAGKETTLHQRARLVMQAAALSPTVRGKMAETSDAMVAATAVGLARRHKVKKPSLEMLTVAAVADRLFQGATNEWAQRGPRGFPAIVERHFGAFRRAMVEERRIDDAADESRDGAAGTMRL